MTSTPAKKAVNIIALAAVTLLTLLITACTSGETAQGKLTIIALAPQSATAGDIAHITISAQKGSRPAQAAVTIELTKTGDPGPLLRHQDQVHGTKTIALNMPNQPDDYTLRISGIDRSGETFDQQAVLKIEKTAFLILQTDRPTYRPGSDLRMRAILMNRELKPVQATVSFTVYDSHGASVHQHTADTGQYGMADSSLPISPEPRTGEWIITASAAGQEQTATVLVDHYTLPKYQLDISPANPTVPSGNPARGQVTVNHNHGPPAKGILTLTPLSRKHDSQNWVEGTITIAKTAGTHEYSFNTAQDWTGQLRVEAKFQENPLHEGQTSQALHTVQESGPKLTITPAANTVRPGLPFTFTIANPEHRSDQAEHPAQPAQPAQKIKYTVKYTGRHLTDHTLEKDKTATLTGGSTIVRVDVPKKATSLTITVTDQYANIGLAHLNASHSPTGRYIQLENITPGQKEPGDTVTLRTHSTAGPHTVHWQAIAKGRITASGSTNQQEFDVSVTGAMSPYVRVLATVLTPDGEILTSQADIDVATAYPMNTTLQVNPKAPRPGDNAVISVSTQGPSLVSVAGADRATHVLAGTPLDPEELLRKLGVSTGQTWNPNSMERDLAKRDTHLANPGSHQLLEANDVSVLTNAKPLKGRTLIRARQEGSPNSWGGRNNNLVTRIAAAPWRYAPWQDEDRDSSPGETTAWVAAALALAVLTVLTVRAIHSRSPREQRIPFTKKEKKIAVIVAITIVIAGALFFLFIIPWYFTRIVIEPVGGSMAGTDSGASSYRAPSAQVLQDSDTWLPPDNPQRPGEAAPAAHVRSNFPETWLWELEYTDAAGNLTLDRTVPDSITSWDLRSIAMSTEHGLGVAQTSVPVSQPIYLTANLPPRTIRRETVPLTVTAYNHTPLPQDVRVTLSGPAHAGIHGDTQQNLTIEAHGNASATFHMTPTQAGDLPVHIEARGQTHSDAMQVTTNVRTEGIPHEQTTTLILKPNSQDTARRNLPARIVEDSHHAALQVTGSRLARPMDNIGSMLRIPQGCGEQNMAIVGPNAQILLYLATQPSDKNHHLIKKATRLMQQGYQRQLTYQRKDGSFSAFGDQDPHGSVWLTAYTMRTLAITQRFIHVDPSVLRSAAVSLANQQQRDGSFELKHRTVHNSELVQDNAGITAYVTLALMELSGTRHAVNSAVKYLEHQVETGNHLRWNNHTTALSALVLAKGESAHTHTLLTHLADNAQILGLNKTLVWNTGTDQAETTAYASMAMQHGGQHQAALNAADTLVTLQDSRGAYYNTHATAMAIEAIRTSGTVPETSEGDTTVNLQTGDWQHSITIPPNRAKDTFHVQLPANTQDLTAVATGPLATFITITDHYNTLPERTPETGPMDLQVEITPQKLATGQQATVAATVHYRDHAPDQAGMFTVEIQNPTGTSPVPSTLTSLVQSNPRIMRADDEGQRTVIYLDWMGPGETITLSYNIQAIIPVQGQPATAQAYAYYRPEIRADATVPPVNVTR